MPYAEKTEVPVEKSRAEIEKILERYGARKFSYGRDDDKGVAIVMFEANSRYVRFTLNLPLRGDKRFQRDKRGVWRDEAYAQKTWEQSCRQKWRALALCIKAKLEAVESGICLFEEEFLAQIVLPDGNTAGQWLHPQIAAAYESGKMPRNLLALPAPTDDEE